MALPDKPLSAVSRAEGVGTQYLTFRLGSEEYAIDILCVQEIKGFSTITPIPNAPAHIKGVINLRGTVVPVIGLRERFGMSTVQYDKFTVIAIVSVGTKAVGVVVDAVTDVLTLKSGELQPPPELGADVDTSFIIGMAKTAERLVIVLDIEKALRDALNATLEPQRTERAAPKPILHGSVTGEKI
jgi:purine-binding chemotaxis protein CheW